MEASISVVCYKHKTLANGENPLMLRIAKDGKRTMKSLGISINPVNWDFEKNEPKLKCPNRKHIQQLILNTKVEYQKRLLEKAVNEEEYTSDTLVEEQQKTKIKACTVDSFYQTIISDLKAKGNVGNSYAYLNSYNMLKSFNNGKKLIYTFSHIDVSFLRKYEDWFRERNLKDTTISYHFRTLRATYNKAIESKVVSANKNPFTQFKISKFSTKTQKRALSKEEVWKIIDADTSNRNSDSILAQDIFTFSYLCGGISFVDIANLTSANIVGDRLIYARQKTHKPINLKLCDKAKNLIEKYNQYSKEAAYLFPVLHIDRHTTPMQKKNRVHKICHAINKELRLLAKSLKIKTEVTTYVARHSFATVLKRSGVNIALISEALGHSDLATTQIYLDSFETSQIDAAMANLL